MSLFWSAMWGCVLRGSGDVPYSLADFVVQVCDALVGPVLPQSGQNVAQGVRPETREDRRACECQNRKK